MPEVVSEGSLWWYFTRTVVTTEAMYKARLFLVLTADVEYEGCLLDYTFFESNTQHHNYYCEV